MLPLALLALMPRVLLGFLVVDGIWKSPDHRDHLIKIFLAGPAGIGISSLAGFLWIWAKWDLRIYAAIETIGAVLFSLLIAWNRRSALVDLARKPRVLAAMRPALWTILSGLAFILFTGEFWIAALHAPHGAWDAWGIWNLAARFIYRGGAEHWTGLFSLYGGHPDYPLLIGVSNAITWILLRQETTRGPMALAFLFGASIIGLLFSLIHRLRDSTQAALAAIVLATQAFVIGLAAAQYADLPFSCYFLASVGLLPVYAHSRKTSVALLAGLAAGLAAWTKNEGIPLLFTTAIAWACASYWARTGAAVKGFFTGLSFPLIVVVLFKSFLAPQNYLFSQSANIPALASDAERYGVILIGGASALWTAEGTPMLIAGALLVYALIVGRSRQKVAGLGPILLVAIAQFLFYMLSYAITPLDPAWQIRTSINRLYLHVFTPLLLAVFLWLKSPMEMIAAEER
jgi:hypothetical protein